MLPSPPFLPSWISVLVCWVAKGPWSSVASSSAWVLPYKHWSLGDDIPQDLEILENMEDREHHQPANVQDNGRWRRSWPPKLFDSKGRWFFWRRGGGSQFSDHGLRKVAAKSALKDLTWHKTKGDLVRKIGPIDKLYWLFSIRVYTPTDVKCDSPTFWTSLIQVSELFPFEEPRRFSTWSVWNCRLTITVSQTSFFLYHVTM